ncbi:jupiter microtubule associated homolog 1-like [Littorina saxatilis]|uniref:Microtubule-associated protein Jupiter n=1 Tax=Littorina saxatilis TaxID=31220 RepID=A0AAN9B4R6_9CAEN
MSTTSTFSGLTDEAKPSSRVLRPPGGASSNIFGAPDPAPAASAKQRTAGGGKPSDSAIFGASSAGSGQGNGGQRAARDGAYNPITGTDYKDLAPNHHALHVKETPKAQKEQPPLPCSDDQYQARGGKMQNVQTSTRVTNPPGGKTTKLW